MRTKTPFRRKRLISRGSSSSSSVEVKVERELQCSRCKAIFPDYLARCPECGSEEWIGLVEVNPYTDAMETFLKACGHLLWLVGTIGFLVLLWQTDSPDAETNKLFIYGAFLLLFCSVLFSAAYFGMSEIMRRILRMQRRLRAFHENYRDDQPEAATPAPSSTSSPSAACRVTVRLLTRCSRGNRGREGTSSERFPSPLHVVFPNVPLQPEKPGGVVVQVGFQGVGLERLCTPALVALLEAAQGVALA